MKVKMPVLYASILGMLVLCLSAADALQVKEGAWVLYEKTFTNDKGVKLTGDLKISALGKEKFEGKDCRWIEIHENLADKKRISKLLVEIKEPKDLQDNLQFWGEVHRLIIQDQGKEAMEIPRQSYANYLPNILEYPRKGGKHQPTVKKSQIKELKKEKLVIADKGKIKAEHKRQQVSEVSKINLGFINLTDTLDIQSDLWASDKVPLTQVAKFQVKYNVISVNKKPDGEEVKKGPKTSQLTLVIKDYGDKGAKSMISGEVKKMQLPKFPFLMPQQQKEGK